MEHSKFFPVCFDFDGVLLDFASTVREVCKKFNVNIPDEPPKDFYFTNWFSEIDSSTYDKIIDTALQETSSSKPYEENIDYVRNIISVGYIPVIVTSRSYIGPVNKWLKEYGLGKCLVLSSRHKEGDKASIVNALSLNVLVEDNPKYLDSFIQADPNNFAIIMSRPWNQNYSNDRSIRITELKQLNSIFSRLSKIVQSF
jgi:hypothetical protein